ncbi:MAG: Aspartyl/glutamyl-tRNA(Asn/Gln) amidotransferase subunit B [Euryarchaeota archaeon ADurb.Bin023]|nr:Asp-tRNA(Asn)/Glu-tRNA(Gln) amidotransferase subunit GatB [Methanofastidiosum sp.]OQC51283.1 MAG: Aspartyl/glutamyl-tRNA(Asn/Gln) amidotransferase subunit B [Euryarchaeota archaeon ADurb.Bin023]HNV94041.1 Asp-tRNA(Asn)/Glu-tRNA(Gln) amidotransferase subunit GatB [Methanofastidiosum sp.]HNZ60961.1 Asp-tRNA(Asn)/Glu-tRNA(Gln) amidotransferase subunit GatB [Methanofastidiosum sp.]HOE93612.1 Asp-tRNA(Asn)/Glu-tRNA(Gln) amidotransferase subunit GatB [Methanofastidiosum sp.]
MQPHEDKYKDLNLKIGLEIHVQLKTEQKIFCECSTDYINSPPNNNICPICTSQPGSKPMGINEKALENLLKIGLFLGCKACDKPLYILRKHYFYPDLPSNYQRTSQHILEDGIFMGVGIWEIHIEEDPGRYELREGKVDLNRCGIPLAEIVTAPDIKSPEYAREFLRDLLLSLDYLGVIRGESGSVRADVNISIMGGNRIEIKNVNSVKGVYKALKYEIVRQKAVLQRGGTITMETRHFDEGSMITKAMRKKETLADYRYIPDPDLVPFYVSPEGLSRIESILPESPHNKKKRFIEEYSLGEEIVDALISDLYLSDFFEECAKDSNPLEAGKWCATELKRRLNEKNLSVSTSMITPKHISDMIDFIEKGELSVKNAKWIIGDVVDTGEEIPTLMSKKNFYQIRSEDTLIKILEKVMRENPKAVLDYKSGNQNALHFLFGKVVNETEGRADPSKTIKLLKDKLYMEA